MTPVYILRTASSLIWIFGLLGLLPGCSSPSDEPDDVLVFAAASLANVLAEIETDFEARSEVGVAISYGGSQLLAGQIVSGAPADLFISAGQFPVNFLAEHGLLEGDATDLLTNRLVVAVRSGQAAPVDSMEQLDTPVVERIAVADPVLAPAGRYAQEALTRLGLWDAIQAKLVLGPDVRATLAYVESGNADAALVYVTDARASRNIEVLDIVPASSYSRITYPAAIIARDERPAGTTEFLDFLKGEPAMEIFRRHGFDPVE